MSLFRILRRSAAILRAWRLERYRDRENRARQREGRISLEAVRKAVAWEDAHRAMLEAPTSNVVDIKSHCLKKENS